MAPFWVNPVEEIAFWERSWHTDHGPHLRDRTDRLHQQSHSGRQNYMARQARPSF